MKRFLSLLIALILAICPIAAFSAPSPTLGPTHSFKSEPKIEFLLPTLPEYKLLYNDYNQYLDAAYDWDLLDVIIINLPESYLELKCSFMIQFKENQKAAIVLTDIDYIFKNTLNGKIEEDGDVIFNFSKIEPGTYIMWVYVSKVD